MFAFFCIKPFPTSHFKCHVCSMKPCPYFNVQFFSYPSLSPPSFPLVLSSLFPFLPVITSSSRRDYIVSLAEGGIQKLSYNWRQTITFESCQHDQGARQLPSSQQLTVDQIFVMYDPANQLIRYAMSNKIGSIHSESVASLSVFFCPRWALNRANRSGKKQPDQLMFCWFKLCFC